VTLLSQTRRSARPRWRAIDDPLYYFVASVVLVVGAGILIIGGRTSLIGIMVLAIALLAVYRTIRAIRFRDR
jgi:hypothetical protein